MAKKPMPEEPTTTAPTANPKTENRPNSIEEFYANMTEETYFKSPLVSDSYKPPFNPDDLWQKTGSYSVYEQMVNDDQVSVCLQLKKDLILGSGGMFEPGDEGQDEMIEELKTIFFEEYEGDFMEDLEEVLTYYDFGISLTEKIFKQREDGRLGLKCLRTRHPNSWKLHQDEKGNVEKYEQSTSQGPIDVNPKSLIHLVNNKRFQNPYGTSDLRPAYAAWFTKTQIVKHFGIFLEKAASPTPVARYDKNAPQSAVDKIFETIKRFQTKTAIAIPKDIEIEFLEAKNSGDAYIKAIHLFNMFIGRALFIPDLLGFTGSETGGGSLALGQQQMNLFFMHINRRRSALENAINHEIVRVLVQYNEGFIDSYPKFKLKPLDDLKAVELAKTWLEAVRYGAYQISPEEVNHFRKLVQFPEGEVAFKADATAAATQGAQPTAQVEPQECETCKGEGTMEDGKPCPDCEGKGVMPAPAQEEPQECADCKGQGTMPAAAEGEEPQECATCKGEGTKPDAAAMPAAGAIQPAPTDQKVADTALNGTQITALLDIADAVATGKLPRDAAVNIITLAFLVDAAEADKLLGSVGKGFEPTKPEPIVPFGGGDPNDKQKANPTDAAPAHSPEDKANKDGQDPAKKFAKGKTPKGDYYKKVDFKKIENKLNDYDQSVSDETAKVVKKMLTDLFDQIDKKNILKNQNVDRIDSLSLKYKKELKQILKASFFQLFKDAQHQAASELEKGNFAAPLTSQEFLDVIESESFQFVGDYEYGILKRVRAELIAAIKNGTPLSEVMGILSNDLNELSQIQIDRFARTKHTEVMNEGRKAFFDSTGVVAAYQYSAILDDRTSDICAGLDGKIFAAEDAPTPPLHFNCRSLLIPITKYEEHEVDTKAKGQPINDFIAENKGAGF